MSEQKNFKPIMKILVNWVICLGIILGSTVGAFDYDDVSINSTRDKKDSSSVYNGNRTSNKDPNPLCAVCTCNAQERTFDCSSKKLNKLFNMSGWTTLNDSGVTIETMTLSRNGIPEVPQFPKFNFRVLNLSFNDISVIARKAFYYLDDMEVLDLSHNMLNLKTLRTEIFEGSYTSGEYLPMKKLRVLLLGNNNLNSLNPNMFEHLPVLEELSLKDNMFKIIDQMTEFAIGHIMTLRVLDLSYMKLLEIPKFMFYSLSKLQYLNLTGNLLTSVPEALDYAINLKWLSLDDNPIESVQGESVFPAIKTLEYLSVSYITTLKVIGRGAFSKLEGLKEIHVCYNPGLTHLHEEAFSRVDAYNQNQTEWPPVKQLYINSNNLSKLDTQLLARWDDMEVIDIRYNPWSCDCDSQWMVETLLAIVEETSPSIKKNIVCAAPDQMKGLSMIDLKHNHSLIHCTDNQPENDHALLIGWLIGLLVGICLMTTANLIYHRGCFDQVRRGPQAFYTRTPTKENV